MFNNRVSLADRCTFASSNETNMTENVISNKIIGLALDVHTALGPGLLAENKVVIEIKSVEALNEVHLAQTLTYMKLGNYKLGLLMNFNVAKLKDGIKRVINGTL